MAYKVKKAIWNATSKEYKVKKAIWNATSKEYKIIIKGQKYMLRLTKKGTSLVPVKVVK
jgi:hypothetical protein